VSRWSRPPERTRTRSILSAAALDAGHEDQLASLLQSSHSLDEFLQALKAAGFRVVPQ
jgi:hypothetical protein